MNADFHYFATYCASIIAGYSNKEAEKIAYSACFVDYCTLTMLKRCGAPTSATTTQSVFELADVTTDALGLREITRIWASFHFLPGDLYAPIDKGTQNYKSKYRLICKPNGKLLIDTINAAKNSSLEAIGIAMHVLADSWAHQNFAGTPSLVINDINSHIYEIYEGKSYQLNMLSSPTRAQNIAEHKYQNSMYTPNENSVMNLGHGRIGHIADLSFIKYRYMPAWANYEEVIKDNPSDFMHAFCQMVYALKYFRNEINEFKLNEYDPIDKYKNKVAEILNKRQLSAIDDWRAFANELAGETVSDFDVTKYASEYLRAEDKNGTSFNAFISHALKQKSMVTNKIYESKNKLAGYSIKYDSTSLKGLKDHLETIEHYMLSKRDGKINRIFKNLKNLMLLAVGIIIIALPSPIDYVIVCYILGTIITLHGVKRLIFYFTNARHAINGGKIFVNSFVLIDLGLLSFLVLLENISLGMYYMVGVLAVYGLIDILRAYEVKKYESKMWILKLGKGILTIIIGILCLIFAKSEEIALLVFSVTCIVLAIGGIISSFTKSADGYIPEI